jgi:hypothetical protein
MFTYGPFGDIAIWVAGVVREAGDTARLGGVNELQGDAEEALLIEPETI